MKKILYPLVLILMAFFLCLQSAPETVKAKAAAVATPKTVKIYTTEDNYPQIRWSKVSNATGYVLYRKTTTDKSWVKVASTKKTHI